MINHVNIDRLSPEEVQQLHACTSHHELRPVIKKILMADQFRIAAIQQCLKDHPGRDNPNVRLDWGTIHNDFPIMRDALKKLHPDLLDEYLELALSEKVATPRLSDFLTAQRKARTRIHSHSKRRNQGVTSKSQCR